VAENAANFFQHRREGCLREVGAAMYYNFVRIHKTLRTTPAMAANVTKRLWEIGDVVDVLEAWEREPRRVNFTFAAW
jgi:hypothetical protein